MKNSGTEREMCVCAMTGIVIFFDAMDGRVVWHAHSFHPSKKLNGAARQNNEYSLRDYTVIIIAYPPYGFVVVKSVCAPTVKHIT